MPTTDSLNTALTYLSTGGAVVLSAMLISWLAENVPQFQALSPGAKQLAMVAACLVLALGAWAVLKYTPPAVLSDLSAPFGIAAAAVAGLLGNQWWHAHVNKATASGAVPISVTRSEPPTS